MVDLVMGLIWANSLFKKLAQKAYEDINLRWYNFDDSEEIILDDRLDDLSVNTQGIEYTEGIPNDVVFICAL